MKTFLLGVGDACCLIRSEGTPWRALLRLTYSHDVSFVSDSFPMLGIIPMSSERPVPNFELNDGDPVLRYRGFFPDRVEL